MANISVGIKKRGSKYLFDGNYTGAAECFFRVYLMEPTDTDNIINLICALNLCGEHASALTYCYALLGAYPKIEKMDTLYFLTAEAFGGVGCVEGCAKMLEKCIKESPEGVNSKDATAFLRDLRNNYTIEEYELEDNVVQANIPNNLSDQAFLSHECFLCMQEVTELLQEKKYKEAIKRVEEEIERGNVFISLLNIAILLGIETGDMQYAKRNAERFKFIDDFLPAELHMLAFNLNEINDNDIAYTVYHELYLKESSDREITFGFAVASERIGDLERAKELALKVMKQEGGVGPASYYLNEIGSCTHSFVYEYEGKGEEKIFLGITEGYKTHQDIYEALDYIRFSGIKRGIKIIDALEKDDFFTELELRRAAVNPLNNIFLRTYAAAKVGDDNVYLNTDGHIIKFFPQMEAAIYKLLGRDNENETID